MDPVCISITFDPRPNPHPTFSNKFTLFCPGSPLLSTGARRSSAETTIHAIEKLSEQKRVVNHELRFMAPQHAGIVLTPPYHYLNDFLILPTTILLVFYYHLVSSLR